MPSIAETYVTIFPETSKIADGIKRALRDADGDVLAAAKRWRKEIDRGLGTPEVPVDADTVPARTEVKKLKRDVDNTRATIKVDVDQKGLQGAATSLRASRTTLIAAAAGIGAALSPNAIAATGNALVALSGSLGLIPAVAGTAGLAIGSLKIATLGFGDALKEIKDPEKFAEAIAQLSPNAQEAARGIQTLMPEIDKLKFTVQDAFFQPFLDQIQSLGTTYLPMFRTVMSQMSASAGAALADVGKALQTPELQGGIQAMTGNMAGAFDQLSQALAPLVKSFVDIGLVGSGFLPELATAAKQAAESFAQFIAEARSTGDLQGWIQTGLDAMKQLGGVIKNVGSIFMSIFQAGTDVGGGLLGSLQKITQVFADFLNSPAGQGALTAFMTTVHNTLVALAPAATSLLQALAPLVGVIGTALASAVQAIAPALTTWFNAMQPVISQLSAALLPVIQQMAPVLGQLAMMLANQMVSGIQQILPVLIPFVQQMGRLLVAVLPLLPPLLQLAISAMPTFQKVIAAILPFLTKMADLFTQQANVIIPAVVSSVQFLADMFGSQFDRIQFVVEKVWNVIGPILEKMKQALDAVAGPIKAIAGLFGGASANAQAALSAAMPQLQRGGRTITPQTSGWGGQAAMAWGRPATGGSAPWMTAPVSGWGGSAGLAVPPVSSYVAPPPSTGKKSGSGSSASPGTYVTSDNVLNAIGLAQSASGQQYGYGGLGPGSTSEQGPGLYDCSGFMSDLYAAMTGQPLSGNERYFTTESDFSKLGFEEGFQEGAFNIGVHNGGGGKSSHMAGTLPNGVNVESGSNGTLYGGKAKGALDPQFEKQYHLAAPASMYPSSSSMGLDSAGGMGLTGDPATDKRLRDAQQRVDDRAQAVKSAQMRLDELNAKGTATAKQRADAEYALAKAKREHADAVTDLGTAEQKAKSGSGGKSGTGGEQLGQDILGGMAEIFGLDGSVFGDPTQFGLFKILKGVMGLKPAEGAVQGGDGASLFGSGGGGGGLSSILGMVPQAFGELNVGSPADAPGQFMPSIGGSGGSGAAGVALPNMMTSPFAPPGAPGPGNAGPNVTVDQRGANFGHSPTAVQDSIQKGMLPPVRTGTLHGMPG